MSSLPRNIGCPPIVTTAPSVDIRVLVLRLLKVIATVLPVRAPSRFFGMDPDLMAFLWDAALRISVVSSAGVRSAMERRWRGANGDVTGLAGEDIALLWTSVKLLKAVVAVGRRRGIVVYNEVYMTRLSVWMRRMRDTADEEMYRDQDDYLNSHLDLLINLAWSSWSHMDSASYLNRQDWGVSIGPCQVEPPLSASSSPSRTWTATTTSSGVSFSYSSYLNIR